VGKKEAHETVESSGGEGVVTRVIATATVIKHMKIKMK
jgi:hypothetical protein